MRNRTASRIDKIRELKSKHLTDAQIGKALGLSSGQVRYTRQRFGLLVKKGDVKKYDWELAKRLIESGTDIDEVARQVGCCRSYANTLRRQFNGGPVRVCTYNKKDAEERQHLGPLFNYREWLEKFLRAAWERDFKGRERAHGAAPIECASYLAWRKCFCKSDAGQRYLEILNGHDSNYTRQNYGWDDFCAGRRVSHRYLDR